MGNNVYGMSTSVKPPGYWQTYYQTHREQRRATAKKWAASHPTYEADRWAANKDRLSARYKTWYYANQERNRERERLWREANPEHRRDYYLATREHTLAVNKAWTEAHLVETRAAVARWRKTDKGRAGHATDSSRRRARLRGGGGSHTSDQWRDKCDLLGNVCIYCGEPKRLERDHKIPVSQGGTDDITNIVPACRTCNTKKSARTSNAYIAYRMAAASG